MKKSSTKPIFRHEQRFLKAGYDFVIGIDEAGRGPLAGPVVACAVLPRNRKLVIGNKDKSSNHELLFTNYSLIRDSKTLSEKQRESLYDFILENFYVGVGICDHKTIDRINILEATYLAMKKAIVSLKRNYKLLITNCIILVDGNKTIPNLSIEQRAIVNGDKFIKSISAASIVAKVTRDRIMGKMHEKYPEYNFQKHKGYGTRLHMVIIKKHGPCKIHRKSFRPFSG